MAQWGPVLQLGAGLALTAVAFCGPPDGFGGRVLLGMLALVLVFSGGVLLGRAARERQRLEELADAAEQVAGGALHVFLPASGTDARARLGRAINNIAELARAERLAGEPERVVDRTIVREAPSGVLVVGTGGIVRRCNPAAKRMLLLSSDPLGQPIHTLAPTAVTRVADAVMRSRAQVEEAATIGRIDVFVRGVPLANGADCLVLVHDITSIRRAERARRDFVANVSHELKTPITSILAYLETLLGTCELPADSLPMLDAVRRNAERLHALTEDVLHLSRLEARTSDLPLDDELLAPLLEDVVERHRLKAEQRGVRVELSVPETLTASTNADALDHAVANLLDNAIKYGTDKQARPERARVRVVANEVKDGVEIRVEDFGRGIDPQHHDRVFERFYRVDEGRARGVGGTGLGLALVKHLCLAMRAEVRLQSTLGQGATFILRLPPPVGESGELPEVPPWR